MTMTTTTADVTATIGSAMTLVATDHGRERTIAELCRPTRPVVVAFANAHGCNLAARDASFRQDLLAADVLLRDGAGAALLCHRLGRSPGINMNGTDLIPILVERHVGRTAAVFGTSEPWLSTAAEVVGLRCEVVTVADGFLDDASYVEALRRRPADLVILGMGMPRQERVAQLLRDATGRPCLIVCGGAILDFMGGRVSRAPAVLRRFGLEWTWRLLLEPRRMFRRYVVGNAVFLARVAKVRRT
jgi:exopolysaccharide biosynthesis WecB/TagA/CpsF family protein